MLRIVVLLALLVAAACGGKAKQPAATPPPAPTEATPASGSGADTGSEVPEADDDGKEGGTLQGDPCDGGE